jgi:dipeptidyl aminopeptidase/acylaminoacyl peptidase
LIYLQDKDGDENWHLYAVDVNARHISDITPHENIQAQPIQTDKNFPNEIYVGMNVRDKRLHDVYKINLMTRSEELLCENPGNVVEWITDTKFNVRAALAQTPDGGFELCLRDGSQWRPFVRWSFDDGFPAIFGFASDNSKIFVSDSRNWNASRLVEINITTGDVTVLAADPEYDVSSVIVHPDKHYIQAVSFYKERSTWSILDETIRDDFERLQAVDDGEIILLNRNHADTVWLVAFNKDNGPVTYYAYDRTTKTASFLFTNRPKLEHYPLASMKPISFKARDGLTLHGYLTLPIGVEPTNLPMVLNVHGGPWVRDTWGFNPEVQWFANRGYACLQINYRGSTGYGKEFLNAGNRQWGAKMHDDLIDAVNWAIQQGIADPKRIAIYGGSYGGYAALAGAAFTPDVFACAVDVVGPSNIITLINSIPPYWEPMKKQFLNRVGDPETESEFLQSRSPLFRADKIKIPMLIAQGANDPRVKQAESEQIVEALRKKGKDVEYMLFPDEGHGFARPENRLKFYAAAEKFLAKHLGGRAEI